MGSLRSGSPEGMDTRSRKRDAMRPSNQHASGLGAPLAGLLEAWQPGGEQLVVRFPRPLAPHAQQLVEALGARVVIDPTAPALSTLRSTGRPGKTRRELSDDERRRMRESYLARPDTRRRIEATKG